MIDLTPIEQYISDKNLQHSQQAAFTISRIGFNQWFKDQMDIFCNCTKTFKDGSRCTQTNDLRYNYELTTTIQMIEQFGEDRKDYYYEQVLIRHALNIQYESVHGFNYDPKGGNKKKTSNTTRKINKQSSMDLGDKPKKESAADRKLKAHAIKLGTLMFKPKPANNDNVI